MLFFSRVCDMPQDCIFCRIVAGAVPSFRIFENDSVVAFADINPATKGHTLVVPRKHFVNILDIPEKDALDIFAAARKIARAMPAALACAGVNLHHCAGREAWQDVFHFHLHVIPRYSAGELRQAWTVKPGNPGEISKVAGIIASELGKH